MSSISQSHSSRVCCVDGCKTKASSGDKLHTLFHFPKILDAESVELYKEWMAAVENHLRKGKRRQQNSARLHVCDLHFEKSCFFPHDITIIKNGTTEVLPRKRLRLKKNAVPTIFKKLDPESSESSDLSSDMALPEFESVTIDSKLFPGVDNPDIPCLKTESLESISDPLSAKLNKNPFPASKMAVSGKNSLAPENETYPEPPLVPKTEVPENPFHSEPSTTVKSHPLVGATLKLVPCSVSGTRVDGKNSPTPGNTVTSKTCFSATPVLRKSAPVTRIILKPCPAPRISTSGKPNNPRVSVTLNSSAPGTTLKSLVLKPGVQISGKFPPASKTPTTQVSGNLATTSKLVVPATFVPGIATGMTLNSLSVPGTRFALKPCPAGKSVPALKTGISEKPVPGVGTTLKLTQVLGTLAPSEKLSPFPGTRVNERILPAPKILNSANSAPAPKTQVPLKLFAVAEKGMTLEPLSVPGTCFALDTLDAKIKEGSGSTVNVKYGFNSERKISLGPNSVAETGIAGNSRTLILNSANFRLDAASLGRAFVQPMKTPMISQKPVQVPLMNENNGIKIMTDGTNFFVAGREPFNSSVPPLAPLKTNDNCQLTSNSSEPNVILKPNDENTSQKQMETDAGSIDYTIENLYDDLLNLNHDNIPRSWTYTMIVDRILFSYFGDTLVHFSRSFLVRKDMSIEFRAEGKITSAPSEFVRNRITCVEDALMIMKLVMELYMCEGPGNDRLCGHGFYFHHVRRPRSLRCLPCSQMRKLESDRMAKKTQRASLSYEKKNKEWRNIKQRNARLLKKVESNKETIVELIRRCAELSNETKNGSS